MWKFHPHTKTNQNVTPVNIKEERLYYTTTFCDELVLDLQQEHSESYKPET